MFTTELDNFVKKFYQLWNAGHTAHLDVDTHAGKAWVGLRVQLGHAPGPLHHQPQPPIFQAQKKTFSPSRQRRRARRAAARLTKADEAVNMETPKDTTIEEIVNVEETVTEEPHQSPEVEEENKTAEEAISSETETKKTIAEQADPEHSCDLCEKSFGTLKGLRAHVGRQHKTSSSPIPQIDGVDDSFHEATFCKICQSCHEETKTVEDLNYHVMNNHEANHVFEIYGHDWVDQRRYCIRRGSPFFDLLPH
jgi:hypothetical protein